MNILYIPLTRRESGLGWLLLALYMPLFVLLTMVGQTGGLLALAFLPLIILPFRRFWKEILEDVPFTGKALIWKPLLACFAAKVICIIFNDLSFFYGVTYYVSTDWGPLFWDVRAYLLGVHWGIFPVVLLLVSPIVEEFLFRGVVYGSILPHSSLLAVVLSTLLFGLMHTLPCLYLFGDSAYAVQLFIQYIPLSLFLIGVYRNTDTLAAPILAHEIYNLFLLKTTLQYL